MQTAYWLLSAQLSPSSPSQSVTSASALCGKSQSTSRLVSAWYLIKSNGIDSAVGAKSQLLHQSWPPLKCNLEFSVIKARRAACRGLQQIYMVLQASVTHGLS